MESCMCTPRTMRSISADWSATDHQHQQPLYSPPGRKMSASGGQLCHEDVLLCQKTMAGMNAFRKCGKLCDVTLEVEGHNVLAHRVILASASSWLCEMFTSQEDSGTSGSDDTTQRHIKIHGVDYDSLSTLINFAYTCKLDVPSEKVAGLYKAAKKLKMQSAVDACSHYLISNLSPTNCIGIRSFASSCSELTAQTDLYIQNHLLEVMNNSREFFALKKLRFDILGVEDSRLVPGGEKVMCELVVHWLQQTVKWQDIEAMTDEPHLLLLNAEGSLCDCLSLSQDSPACLDSAVRDYRNLGKCKQLAPVKVKEPKSPGVGNTALSQTNGVSLGSIQGGLRARSKSLESGSPSTEWSLVAWHFVAERVCICVAVLDDRLVTMSLKLQNHHVITPPPQDVCDANGMTDSRSSSPPVANGYLNGGKGETQLTRSLLQVAHMSAARCAMGVVVIGRQLVVLGGYDRGECLNSVESYDMQSNSWSSWPHMQQARGRFNAAALGGKMVACGGSTGSDDLKSVESYDPDTGKWTSLPDMLVALSNAGVAVLDNKLYVVGGSQGRSATSMCQVYEPTSSAWSNVADLNTERSQAAVCAVGDKLVVAGGSDFMNCLNSVEIYDPDTNTWEDSVPMVTARRGAGIVFFRDKLYVIGGSDGQSSLCSVEIYDLSTEAWSLGPSLNTPRANVGVAILDERLFAIGGYNGKTFLDTVEYLMEDGHEWTLFMPVSTEPSTPTIGNGRCPLLDGLGDDARSC